MSPLIVLVAPAWAGEVDAATAEALARSFYAQTGREVPEAFLQDDVDALMDSERDAEELGRAITWIVANVPSASRYTLSGILESHLATALGEEEILVIPEDFVPPELAAEPITGWEPSASQIGALISSFYLDTDRDPPSPPRPEDVAAVKRLANYGWTQESALLLVQWVPENVSGVELLGFDQVVRLALDNRFLGGPTASGTFEQIDRAEPVFGEPRKPLYETRDPLLYDGGRLRTVATMGALPGAVDLAHQGVFLPGAPLRSVELDGRYMDQGAGAAARFAQGTDRYGLLVEGRAQQGAPGDRHVDGSALEPLAAGYRDGLISPVSGGRAVIGFDGPPRLGAGVYGYRSAQRRLVGVELSMMVDLPALSFWIAGGADQLTDVFQSTLDVVSAGRFHWEGGARVPLPMDHWLWLRVQNAQGSGGLVEDGFPVENDLYSVDDLHMSVRVDRQSERFGYGASLGYLGRSSQLDWTINDNVAVDVYSVAEPRTELQAAVGAELAIIPALWVFGGARAATISRASSEETLAEVAVGGRYLVADRAWVAAALRTGTNTTSLHGQLAIPF